MNKRRFWIIVIALHALCFGKQLFFQTSSLQDSKEYLFAADNLLQYHTLYAWDLNEPFKALWLTKRPFLYPLTLSTFRLLSFGNTSLFIFLVLIIQNLISIYTLRIAEKIVLKLKGKINYNFSFLLVLLTPAQVIYANLIMSEIWLGFTLILFLQCLLFYENNLKKITLLGLLCIIAMAFKPVMMFTAFCLPVYCLYIFRLKHLQKVLPLSLLPLLFLVGTSLVNQYRTGYYHYSSISNINLLKYNAYTLLIYKYGTHQADSIVDTIQYLAARQPNYAAEQQFINKNGKQIISSNIGLYTYLHTRGALLCLLDPGRFDITQFFNLSHNKNLVYEINKKDNMRGILLSFFNPLGLILLCLFLFNLVKIYFVLRFIFLKTIPLTIRLTMFFFPAYILFFTGPIGSSRFALPFFPIFLVIVLITQNAGRNESPNYRY